MTMKGFFIMEKSLGPLHSDPVLDSHFCLSNRDAKRVLSMDVKSDNLSQRVKGYEYEYLSTVIKT